jgi:hypothetical protein
LPQGFRYGGLESNEADANRVSDLNS